MWIYSREKQEFFPLLQDEDKGPDGASDGLLDRLFLFRR